MKTHAEMARYVGQSGLYIVDGLQIEVSITDARTIWNRTDLLISPKMGAGHKWVSMDSVKIGVCEVR